MRFTFSAPLRTHIALDTMRALEKPDQVAQWIGSLPTRVESILPKGVSVTTQWRPQGAGELRFAALDEDLLPPSARPLFRLVMEPAWILQTVPGFSALGAARLNRAYIDYFDNTVALLLLDMDLGESPLDANGLGNIDHLSTALCSSLVQQIKPLECDIRQRLGQILAGSGLFRQIGQFEVFTDRNQGEGGQQDMLWVTRLLHLPQMPDDPSALESWTQQPAVSSQLTPIGEARVAFCVGNSFVVGRPPEEERLALERSLLMATYFYVLHDVLNRRLTDIFVSIQNTSKKRLHYFRQVNRIRQHIAFLENEVEDVLMGLQGIRKHAVVRFLRTWDMERLTAAVHRKKTAVSSSVDFALREKQARYGRIVEAILATIGGITLLDFALSLHIFAREESAGDDGVSGLVDLANMLSVDATLYGVLAILVILCLLVLTRR